MVLNSLCPTMENNLCGHQQPLLPCSTLTCCHGSHCSLAKSSSSFQCPKQCRLWKSFRRKSCQVGAIVSSGPKNTGGITTGFWAPGRWNYRFQAVRWVFHRWHGNQPWQVKYNGREGEVLDKDKAREEDLKQNTLRSCSKIRLQCSVVEEGAAGVEHCGKCSLHTRIRGRSPEVVSLQCLSPHYGWWTHFKTDFSGLSNKKPFSFLFSDNI